MRSSVLSVYANDDHYHGLPPGSFYRLAGVDTLPAELWYTIASLPGAFVPMPEGPLRATNKQVERWRLQHGAYPSVLAIPKPQWHVAVPLLRSLASFSDLAGQAISVGDGWEPVFAPRLPQEPDIRTGKPHHVFRYQKDAVERLLRDRRITLELIPGAGKTLIALMAAEHLRRVTRDIDQTVVVGPRQALTEVWAEKLAEYYPGPKCVVLSGTLADRKAAYAEMAIEKPPYVFTTYDFWKGGDAKQAAALLLGPRTLVILDETHEVKHVETQRWKMMDWWLGDGAPKGTVQWRLLMTGTMIDDKPWDVYGPIQLLGLRVWNSWEEFRDRYFSVEHAKIGNVPFPQGSYITGFLSAEKAKELESVRRAVGFVRTEAELGLELPEAIPEPHKIRMTKAEETVYQQILETARDDLTFTGVLASMVAEAQFADDPQLLLESLSTTASHVITQVGRSKIEQLVPGSKFRSFCEWLSEHLDGETGKVVVFTRFAEMVELFRRRFDHSTWCHEHGLPEDLGPPSLYYHGTLSEKNADAIFEQFLNDPTKRVFISTDAGSKSLNYQAVSRVVVHYDEPYRMSTLEQRRGRVRRMDQVARSVLYPYFRVVASASLEGTLAEIGVAGSIDERIHVLLEEKNRMRRLMEG